MTSTHEQTMTGSITRSAVEALLYREARFMDEHRFNDWLELWSEDALYWVPANADNIDPRFHVNLIYDDKARLFERIERLSSGAAWAQDPPSRMRRIIGNLEIEEGLPSEVIAYSNFILTELRRSKQDAFAGRTIHTLRAENGSLKIVQKKVLLVNNDEVIDNLTFLI